ncbi:MAG: alanine racemase [Lachnospiraceae bacterium]|nr:alanine racemase [Lachnospiraceae bacterium]MCR5501153.1 alanine racemase [Acetatifactor sp.]
MLSIQESVDSYQRVRVDIDLDAAVENMKNMKQNLAESTKMLAVVKTDGYGHGAPQIASVLEPLDFVWGYATATFEEAHLLRMAGLKKPILILSYSFPYCYPKLAENDVRPAVFREDTLEQLEEAAKKTGEKIKVHVKVDTGMGRIGISPDEKGLAFLQKLITYPHIELEGIFTHFARADEIDKTNAKMQYRCFVDFVDYAEKELGIRIPLKHCSNSAGILELPEANMDLVRAGITLYGLYPSDEVRKDVVPLKPVLSLHSHVVYVKDVMPGQSISYGGTFTADHPMRVATIPVGYGDGYPRSLSSKGFVLIHGKQAKILGRVCMDQFMVDVTEIPECQNGDEVTLIGDGLTAELVGELSGRFNYELVCDLGKRIPRVFYLNGKPVAVRDYYQD